MTWVWENQNHEWTRRDTKGHEGEGGELNHEIHEKHEKHEKTRNDVGLEKSEPRMDTNGHEWGGGEEGS